MELFFSFKTNELFFRQSFCHLKKILSLCLSLQACADFLDLAKSYEKKFNRLITSERSKRMRLEETVETLAKQHNRLERACEKKKGKEKLNTSDLASPTIKGASPLLGNDTQEEEDLSEDEDLFEDAVSDFSDLDRNNCKALEDSTSLNYDSSVELQQNTGHLEIKRSTSEQVLLPKGDVVTHRKWLSEEIPSVRISK